ncbi:hypothetical protein U0070_006990 [Myodes glareolus]|uniref:Uncharacterized protein n=1 Tax=Myodes glareolus TaxID=447135 RepID=A0AAW0IC11_MYOGA
MNTEEATNTMVNYHMTVAPMLRGQPHKELKTHSSPSQSFTQAALDPGHAAQIRSKFGTVSKIFTFTKNNQFWVRLQQADRECLSCQAVPGWSEPLQHCCALHIDFSKLTSLNVKYNNKSRDHTRLHLPSGDSQASLDQTMVAAFGMLCAMSASLHAGARFPPTFAFPQVSLFLMPTERYPSLPCAVPSAVAAAMAGHIAIPDSVGARNSILLVSNLNLERVTPQGPSILSGVYGDAERVKILLDKENAPVQVEEGSQAQLTMSP